MAEWRNRAYQDVLGSVENLSLEEKYCPLTFPPVPEKHLQLLKLLCG